MNHPLAASAASNPFSTRFVRPGAIRYRFPVDDNAESVVSRLASHGWRGQIIGPHGSGKSTLLASLLEPLQRAGRRAWLVTLVDRQRRLPADWPAQAQAAQARLLIIDGYEQLGWWSRLRASAICRQRGWGLLVTTHADAGFSTLVRTAGDLQVAMAIVDGLLDDSIHDDRGAPFDRTLIANAFAATGGNVREMLFRLYDAFEAGRQPVRSRILIP